MVGIVKEQGIFIKIFLVKYSRPKMAYNGKRLCDGGFYTQRFFKTAITKPVL